MPIEGLPTLPNQLCKYYFILDLVKKLLVAVLTGGVIVDAFSQAGVLIAITSSQILFVLLLRPIKSTIPLVLEVFSCVVDVATFVCGLSLLFSGTDQESICIFMLAVNGFSIVVQLAAIMVQSVPDAVAAFQMLYRYARGAQRPEGGQTPDLGFDSEKWPPPHSFPLSPAATKAASPLPMYSPSRQSYYFYYPESSRSSFSSSVEARVY